MLFAYKVTVEKENPFECLLEVYFADLEEAQKVLSEAMASLGAWEFDGFGYEHTTEDLYAAISKVAVYASLEERDKYVAEILNSMVRMSMN